MCHGTLFKPTSVMHVDGDAFFASVEQARHPEWKGRPVATGAERGLVIAASYEAKAQGVKRGMLMTEAKKICRDLIVARGDYETYGLYSTKMFNIVRSFTPQVEEFSIDEGFADLFGLRRLHRASYIDIARRMKEKIETELGLTVSVGLSLTKTLAKMASEFHKPSGFTCVDGLDRETFLEKQPLHSVCGFGYATCALLQKQGIKNVLDFAKRDEGFVKHFLGKTGIELWHELRGETIYTVDPSAKETYQSISKFHTFTPPSTDRERIFAELLLNLDRAFTKARRFHLAAKRVALVLKTQAFKNEAVELKLTASSSSALEMTTIVRHSFDRLFKKNTQYRATGVFLCDLVDDAKRQFGLFEDTQRIEKIHTLNTSVDEINERFGQKTLIPAQGLLTQPAHLSTVNKNTAGLDLPTLRLCGV